MSESNNPFDLRPSDLQDLMRGIGISLEKHHCAAIVSWAYNKHEAWVSQSALLSNLKTCILALDASRGVGEFPNFEEWESSSRAAILQAEGRTAT